MTAVCDLRHEGRLQHEQLGGANPHTCLRDNIFKLGNFCNAARVGLLGPSAGRGPYSTAEI